ncbi:MAG: hypothetical protein GXO19_01400 [Epsilonproteobacteria bacterium]|nr:hypothetical protein [Campylobacterota bacterium]NPA56370.1 hypothetical protein [Campylobacterota bacterium]
MARRQYELLLIGALLLLGGCDSKDQREGKGQSQREALPSEIKITENAVVQRESSSAKSLDKGEFYYSYNKKGEKREENLSDEGRYTQLGAYRYIKNYESVQISLLANKLSKDFLIYCSACHDDYANGVIGPSLLGKSGEYIYNQLQEFKSGKRKNVLMVQLVRRLPDTTLKALADEIAEFNRKVEKIKAQNRLKG